MRLMLIAGLGNPGAEYAATPHNVGFRVVDAIAAEAAAQWRQEPKFSGAVARAKVGGADLMLLKPSTYMNLSGESVGKVMRYFGIEPAGLAVVSDDADLPIGRIRVRAEGGPGGHNGLKSIIGSIGTDAFARIRVGIGRPGHPGEDLAGYVLGRLGPDAEKTLRQAEAAAARAALCVATRGVDEAMNNFNAEGAAVAPSAQ